MKSLVSIWFGMLFLVNPIGAQEFNYSDLIAEHREKYKAGFLVNERSPLEEEDLKHLRFFKAKKKFALKCKVEETPDSKPFEMPTYSGITKPFRKYADLVFEWKGKEYKLEAYQNLAYLRMPQYRTHLFIPYMDTTNDNCTYGGGRYIDLDIKDIVDGRIVLDFNKSYNPWCAFSDGFNCPIPPKANHLPFKVKAGEKMYSGVKKKAK